MPLACHVVRQVRDTLRVERQSRGRPLCILHLLKGAERLPRIDFVGVRSSGRLALKNLGVLGGIAVVCLLLDQPHECGWFLRV